MRLSAILVCFVTLVSCQPCAPDHSYKMTQTATDLWLEDVEGDEALDLDKEALAAVATGQMPALLEVHRANDILTALRLARDTGFVVDKEQGLILTNRHVVLPGPAVAEGVFLDNEEVEIEAILSYFISGKSGEVVYSIKEKLAYELD